MSLVPTSCQIFYNQLVGSLKTGTHSFSIIGSYGTGKSSFLVAFRKNLIGETLYFEPLNGEFSDLSGFEFDYIVGQYGSLIEELGLHFDVDDFRNEKEIIALIDRNMRN
ncbi:MAG: hypothetical protein U5K72_17720 [Balneolaceae bacterium]|nr:hypothetical protein [Balneolaceae bacterium]